VGRNMGRERHDGRFSPLGGIDGLDLDLAFNGGALAIRAQIAVLKVYHLWARRYQQLCARVFLFRRRWAGRACIVRWRTGRGYHVYITRRTGKRDGGRSLLRELLNESQREKMRGVGSVRYSNAGACSRRVSLGALVRN
jgi:hypothetical protein